MHHVTYGASLGMLDNLDIIGNDASNRRYMKDFTQTSETECIALLNKEITSLKEELDYYKKSETALKNALRRMVSKVKTN